MKRYEPIKKFIIQIIIILYWKELNA